MSDQLRQQLPLRIGLRDSATFDNFLPAANAQAVHALQFQREPFVYLWGSAGSGKSHLLQAACHAVTETGGSAVYLPLGELSAMSAELLEGMEQMQLVCIDEVEHIAGNAPWERALFHLYNRLRDSGHRLVVAGQASPAALGLGLPDLVSRLGWGPVYQLQLLTDEEKAEALRMRAAQRGMEMPAEVASYLLNRAPRDMQALFALLDELDEVSLAAQRKLTIPFVRQIIR